MANLEELKKMADAEGVELSEEDLEAIAGGLYSEEEWLKMSPDERRAAYMESRKLKAAHSRDYCKYFDADPT